ncbi:MAG: L,D-transpeptidase [Sulfurimonas sp.]|uniref:L,D-transpeptidase n=1 Tax=Sulfurimonas sp. TaxID=2022749 RepID=UPI00261B9C3B|nr:L,D-transpeptidase [Sulfurimonas sp.]MDD2651455.1 L,D-transpeptidase [Sulfurimonas sp.]MDD3450996.1 L,D-transpeptidase [Sulfurimonas sp.]
MYFLKLFFASLFFNTLVFGDGKFYTLSMCLTKDHDGASYFLNRYLDEPEADIFIVKLEDGRYLTTYGSFNSREKAAEFMAKLPERLKQHKPFIKEFDYNLAHAKDTQKYIFHKENFNYSISVCSSKEYKNAIGCVKEYIPNQKSEVYIIKDDDGLYKTLYGAFQTHQEAQKFIKTLAEVTKSQGPFVKKLPYSLKDKRNYSERILKRESNQKKAIDVNQFVKFEKIVISVDSKTHKMSLQGILDGKAVELKEYKVSTAKRDMPKPLGEGGITSISLHPHWYPTQETIEHFKKTKNINLPSVVPYGHPHNYMGEAKINLTHEVDGKNVFRIHGTVNESTIGRSESGGCIRMKNAEVAELATLLQNYSDKKSMKNIKVILN